ATGECSVKGLGQRTLTVGGQVAQDLGDSRVSRPLQVLRRHHLDWAGCLEVSALDHGPRDHYLLELLSGGCLGGHLRLRCDGADGGDHRGGEDRKSTRLNSSHRTISYAVFCLKKKKKTN